MSEVHRRIVLGTEKYNHTCFTVDIIPCHVSARSKEQLARFVDLAERGLQPCLKNKDMKQTSLYIDI
jgi:hypothetical protein